MNEWFAVDLVRNSEDAVVGVVAICIETGDVAFIESRATVLATGGAGRIYASTTNAVYAKRVRNILLSTTTLNIGSEEGMENKHIVREPQNHG